MVEDIIITVKGQIDAPIVAIDSVFIKYVANGIVINVNSISIAGYNISVNGITA
jgi:hypothetical protein